MQMIDLKCYSILNGIMAWWSSVEDAARYIVTLYINDAPISEKLLKERKSIALLQGWRQLTDKREAPHSLSPLRLPTWLEYLHPLIVDSIIISRYKQKTGKAT